MRRLEQLCVQYLEATINHRNVLVALCNAASLKLFFIKEFCLKVSCWYYLEDMSATVYTLTQFVLCHS